MSKNALHYAQETFGIYVEKSVYNPYNKKNGGFILETDQLRWDKDRKSTRLNSSH